MHAYLLLRVTSVVASNCKASVWHVFFTFQFFELEEIYFNNSVLCFQEASETKTNGVPKWRQI